MTRRGYLSETANFIKLYMYHCGNSEVPPEYDFWCCISLIAACCQKNVYYQKVLGSSDNKMYPNLYIFLLGKARLGKDTAANRAMKLVKGNDWLNVFQGSITEASLKDYLAKSRLVRGEWVKDANMYIVSPELAASIGAGTLGDNFIKFMTQIYEGHAIPLKEGTRTHGTVTIEDPCLNWLGGSTVEWLMEAVGANSILSGFFARVISVVAKADLSYRVPHPTVPWDYEEVKEELRLRVSWLSQLQNLQFTMDAQTMDIYEHWYMNRPAPVEESLHAIWKNHRVLVIKLAMILALAEMEATDDFPTHGVIQKNHLEMAQKKLQELMESTRVVVEHAMTTPETKNVALVRDKVRAAEEAGISYTHLMKQIIKLGVSPRSFQEAVGTLRMTKEISMVQKGRGGANFLVWNTGIRF